LFSRKIKKRCVPPETHLFFVADFIFDLSHKKSEEPVKKNENQNRADNSAAQFPRACRR